MEIRKTQQAVSVSKVEEDQRVDVTKAKPIGQSQTPDSFEIGSSRTSGSTGNGSASAQPEKKAGQITGGILIKQMTAARLRESGIKSPESTQSKEQTGTRELNQREQNIAEERAPVTDKPPEQAGGMTGDARTRMENSRDAVMQQMTDLYGTPRDGGGQSASSGSSGSGTGSVGGGPGRVTAEQRAKFEEMTGSNYGPQSGASKLAEMEAQMTGGGMNRLAERMAQRSEVTQALFAGLEDDSSGSGPDIGMISQGAGYGGFAGYDESEGLRDNGKGQMAKEYPGLAKAAKSAFIDGGLTSPRKDALDQAEKEQDSTTPTPTTEKKEDLKSQGTLPDGTHVKTGKDGTTVITGTDGSKTLLRPDGSRTVTHPDGSYEDYDSKGKKTGSGPSLTIPVPDEENRGKREEAGLPDLNIPKAPKIQGDIDPTEDAVANDAAGTELSYVAQQGAYGLLGQPAEDRELGGSGNRSTGGNIDYEDQAGWGGREIEEDPGDVDVTPGANEELPPAANQPNQEEESNSSDRFTNKQPIAAQKKQNPSRIEIEN